MRALEFERDVERVGEDGYLAQVGAGEQCSGHRGCGGPNIEQDRLAAGHLARGEGSDMRLLSCKVELRGLEWLLSRHDGGGHCAAADPAKFAPRLERL